MTKEQQVKKTVIRHFRGRYTRRILCGARVKTPDDFDDSAPVTCKNCITILKSRHLWPLEVVNHD